MSISAYALGVVLGAPLIAVLSARLARRTLLIGLMLVFALANGLTGLVPSYRAMLVLAFSQRPAAWRLFRRRHAGGGIAGARMRSAPRPRRGC